MRLACTVHVAHTEVLGDDRRQREWHDVGGYLLEQSCGVVSELRSKIPMFVEQTTDRVARWLLGLGANVIGSNCRKVEVWKLCLEIGDAVLPVCIQNSGHTFETEIPK